MTDLELTKLCAEAVGHAPIVTSDAEVHLLNSTPCGGAGVHENYHPLTDDAQAMALLKRFELFCEPPYHEDRNPVWDVSSGLSKEPTVRSTDLNRAICECVAKMQLAKVEADKRFRQPPLWTWTWRRTMTFRCEACNEVNKRPVTVVLEDRTVIYSTLNKDGKPHQGHEVVKEMRVCEPCADLLVPV